MKTYEEFKLEVMEWDFEVPLSNAQIEILAAKEYAKQYLQEVATKLEAYDDSRDLLSQIPYRLMDEIDAQ